MRKLILALSIIFGLNAWGAEDRLVIRKDLDEVLSAGSSAGCSGSHTAGNLEIDLALLDPTQITSWKMIYKVYYDRSDDALVWDPSNSYSLQADITNTQSVSQTLELDLNATSLLENSYYVEEGTATLNTALLTKTFCIANTQLNALTSDLKKKIYIEFELIYEYGATFNASMDIGMERFEPSDRMLQIGWEFVKGADHYEFEYVFVSDGFNATLPHDDVNVPFSFKEATRLILKENFYYVPMTYPAGSLLYRARAVFMNGGEPEYGDWSYEPLASDGIADARSADVLNPCIYYLTRANALESDKSWTSESVFIENGKRKDMLSFQDGSGRSRQTVSRITSDDVAVVSEKKYDQYGRPALSILPGATHDKGMKYYSSDNGGAANNIDPLNFFSDNALSGSANTSLANANSISSKYYSAANDLDFVNKGAVDDAAGFVGQQTVYLNDGTERPVEVAQPGAAFNLNGTHTEKIFYGKPTSYELDRLFGNEVGYHQYYSKVYTVDENGQVYVNYFDQLKRVIATGLAADSPNNLVSVAPAENNITVELLSKENSVGPNGEYIQSQTLLFSQPTTIDLVYDLTGASVPLCNPAAPDFACRYNVVIEVIDIHGNVLKSVELDAVTSASNVQLTVELPDVGSYTIYRKIELSNNHVKSALEVEKAYLLQTSVMESNGCIPYYVDPVSGCDFGDGDCILGCTNAYEFVSNGVTYYTDDQGNTYEKVMLSGQEYYRDIADPTITHLVSDANNPVTTAIENCKTSCQQVQADAGFEDNSCEIALARMKTDFSPGGQYFEGMLKDPEGIPNPDRGPFDIIPSGDWTSLFGQFSTIAGVSISSWDDASNFWDPSFADLLVEYHPEYCIYLYYCVDNVMSCSNPSGGIAVSTIRDYLEDMYDGHDITYARGNGGQHNYIFTNPLGLSGSSIVTSSSGHLKAGGYFNYINEGWPSGSVMDPLFSQCNDAGSLSDEARKDIQVALQNFIEIKDFSGTPTGGYYSIWYLMDDPDGISATTGNIGLDPDIVDLFKTFHVGLNGNQALFSVLDKYEFFRGVYKFVREEAIYNYMKDDFQCPTTAPFECKYTAAFDPNNNNKYTFWYSDTDYDLITENAPLPGFALGFPLNAMFDTKQTILNNGSLVGTPYDPATNPGGDGSTVGKCLCDNLLDAFPSRDLNAIQADFASRGVSLTTVEIQAILTGCDHEDYSVVGQIPSYYGCTNGINVPQPDCNAHQLQLNQQFALQRYLLALEDYLNDKEKEIRSTCLDDLSDRESLQLTYDLKEYHFTLFYYDRAGNLIKSVPPKGVSELGSVDIAKVQNHRDNPQETFVHPSHSMITNYRYSTLNQLVQKTTPDEGKTAFWYDLKGRMTFSQNAQQFLDNHCSYTLYDALGRIVESGFLDKADLLPDPLNPAAGTNEKNYLTTPSLFAVFGDATNRKDVTYTRYDQDLISVGQFSSSNRQLRHRVAQILTYDEIPVIPGLSQHIDPASIDPYYGSTSPANYTTLTSYSYDILGNINEQVTTINHGSMADHDFLLTYDYDLISGNIKELTFKHFDAGGTEVLNEEFHHRYKYNEDNRLTKTETSVDGVVWSKEAKYFYYPHGPLAREEIGKEVQGVDYAYNLLGWLKQINGIAGGDESKDLGKDGHSSYGNANFPEDAFKSYLGYYENDYAPIATTGEHGNPSVPSSYLGLTGGTGQFWTDVTKGLYNGSIAYNITGLTDMQVSADRDLLKAYSYDQLNRLSTFDSYTMSSISSGVVNPTVDLDYYSVYNYDANGNFTSLRRKAPGFNDFGQYNYLNDASGNATNQLGYVDNSDNNTNSNQDRIPHNVGTPFTYDAIGNLKSDGLQGISEIHWNVTRKVSKVAYSSGKELNFKYDGGGYRTIKEVDDGTVEGTYYIRDVYGNPFAIYSVTGAGNPQLSELEIYGSSRIGSLVNRTSFGARGEVITPYKGDKSYEFTDHLGNVMAVVSDMLLPQLNSGGDLIVGNDYEIRSYQDYYPFGLMMPGRKYVSSTSYRYGFNGMERDDEFKSAGNHYTSYWRQYDPRLGRWFSSDPVTFPGESPYVNNHNNPINLTDPDGDAPWALFTGIFKAGAELVGQTISNGIQNLHQGKGFFHDWAGKVDWADVGIEFVGGVLIGFGLPPSVADYGATFLKSAVDWKGNDTWRVVGLHPLTGHGKSKKDFTKDLTVNAIGLLPWNKVVPLGKWADQGYANVFFKNSIFNPTSILIGEGVKRIGDGAFSGVIDAYANLGYDYVSANVKKIRRIMSLGKGSDGETKPKLPSDGAPQGNAQKSNKSSNGNQTASGEGPSAIQLGAFKQEWRVRTWLIKLRHLGLEPYTERVWSEEDQTWLTRVRIKYSKENLQKAEEILNKSGKKPWVIE